MTEMIFELVQKPYAQVLLFILLTILSAFIIRPENTDKTWNIAGLFFIGFIFVNSILICTVPNSWSYFFYSIGFSVLYILIISFIMPAIIKLLKVDGSGESGMIFLFIIYHPVLLLLMMFLNWGYFKVF